MLQNVLFVCTWIWLHEFKPTAAIVHCCMIVTAEFEIIINWNWSVIPYKQEHCYRLSMASLLEMYSKFGQENRNCSTEWWKLVWTWPMADCYFKLCYIATYSSQLLVSLLIRNAVLNLFKPDMRHRLAHTWFQEMILSVACVCICVSAPDNN